MHFFDGVLEPSYGRRIRRARMFHNGAKFEAGKIDHRELIDNFMRQAGRATIVAILASPTVATKMHHGGRWENLGFFYGVCAAP